MKKFARTKTGIFFSTKNITEEHYEKLIQEGVLDRKADCIPALIMDGDLIEYRILFRNRYRYGFVYWGQNIQEIPMNAEISKIYTREGTTLDWKLRAWINPINDEWEIYKNGSSYKV